MSNVEEDILYHYDSEGRLIAETNGTAGDTIRSARSRPRTYGGRFRVWLGLTPIGTYAASNDNALPGESYDKSIT